MDEITLNEIFDKLQTINDILLNINSWFEVLVIGSICLLIVVLFYLTLKNFI